MKIAILSLVIVIGIGVSNGFSAFNPEPGADREYVMVLDYTHPCDEMFRVAHEEKYYYGYWYFKDEAIKMCNQLYKDSWLVAVNAAKDCSRKGYIRVKRGAFSTALTIFGNAFTNLIASHRMSNEEVRPGADRRQVEKFFYKGFNMDLLRRADSLNLVNAFSHTGRSHEAEMNSAAVELPAVIWSIAKAHGEIVASAANMKAIARSCKIGQLATAEFSELAGMQELAAVDPSSTELLAIEDGPRDNSLQFRFVLKGSVAPMDRVMHIIWFCSRLTGLASVALLIFYCVISIIKRWRRAPAVGWGAE